MKVQAYSKPVKIPAEGKISLYRLLSEGVAPNEGSNELEAALADANVRDFSAEDVIGWARSEFMEAAENSDAEPMRNYWHNDDRDEEGWDGGSAKISVEAEKDLGDGMTTLVLEGTGTASLDGVEPSTHDYPGYGGDYSYDVDHATVAIYQDGDELASVDITNLI